MQEYNDFFISFSNESRAKMQAAILTPFAPNRNFRVRVS